MRKRIPTRDIPRMFEKAAGSGRSARTASAIFATIIGFLCSAPLRHGLQAAANPSANSTATSAAAKPISLSETLGVHFIPGSSSSVLIERDGKTYLVDLTERTIKMEDPSAAPAAASLRGPESSHSSQIDPSGVEIFGKNCARCHGAEGKGGGAMKTPDFTSPAIQASLSDANVTKIVRDGKPGTAMPAWHGKLSEAEIKAVAAYVESLGRSDQHPPALGGAEAKQNAKVYQPADDYLFSLPTGRRLERHGFYFNFTHRFPYTPAFSGTGSGNTLFGLDDFAIASFGLRYGVTDKLSVSAYRSPSIIGRPIELMIAYHFWDEHDGDPVNVSARLSEDGQNSFSKNFTTNLEAIISRSVTHRAQLYFVPTVSFQNRELISKPGELSSAPPTLPGFNTFTLGVGGAVDIRPTVALVAEAMPTLVNGSEIGIHRPAYSFGIQKRVFRHAFTLGFSNSPGTVVAQRAGTRATFVGSPSADTPGGLFIGFDLMRQIY